MKIKQKSIVWYNSIGRVRRDELAREYYGRELLLDGEILEMYLEEVPHYTLKETISFLKLFAEKFVANTETAYQEKEIRGWIDENLKIG